MTWWNWLTQSNAGLLLRIAVGVGFFAILALRDLAQNHERATRWREYAVLLTCVLAAIAYGVLNDQVTSTISWEYFYYGKGLDEQLGPHLPPDPLRLHLAAAIVGIKATWSAGLIIGVVLLLANNPSKSLPRLRYASLLKQLPLILLITATFAVLGALTGHAGLPAHWNEDFAEMIRRNEMRPRNFMTAYGIHLGGYIGGLFGMLAAIYCVRRLRHHVLIPNF
jgi:hypothetical protein